MQSIIGRSARITLVSIVLVSAAFILERKDGKLVGADILFG